MNAGHLETEVFGSGNKNGFRGKKLDLKIYNVFFFFQVLPI